MKNLKKIMFLGAFCSVFAIGTKLINSQNLTSGKMYVGVCYLMAEEGYSNEATAAVGVVGVVDSTLTGAVIGGPVGAGVGLVVGL